MRREPAKRSDRLSELVVEDSSPGRLTGKPLSALETILEKQIQKKEAEKDPCQLGEILTWDEWITDEYYSGALAKDLWAFWRVQGHDIEEEGPPEIVITGSLGGGKSTFGLAYMEYCLYRHSRFRYPNRLYGLGDVSPLVYGYLSTTARTAFDTGFKDLMRYIDSAPYWANECPRRDLQSKIVFQKTNIQVIPGTGRGSGGSLISRNLYFALMDEANFYKKSSSSAMGDLSVTRQTYTALMNRRKTRFGTDEEFVDDSKCLLISSTDHDKSFTEERINEARENGENQKVIIVNPWLARPGKFTKERFVVFLGNESKPPDIIQDVTQAAFVYSDTKDVFQTVYDIMNEHKGTLGEFVKKLPFDLMMQFMEVPMTFLPEFKRDIVQAIKDIAGKAVKASDKLFSNGPAWTASVLRAREAGLVHPFVQLQPCVSEENGVSLRDLFRIESLFVEDEKYGYRFKRHPEAKRYLHVDSSLSECPTGIAMVHQSGSRPDEVTGLLTPTIEVDFVLELLAPEASGDEVSLEEIMRFILWLHKELGVKFGKVSYDMFASPLQLQVFRRYNINAERLSIDSNYGYPKTFTRAFVARTFTTYDYQPLRKSLFGLVDDREKGKIIRPPGIWKDVFDAVVGAHQSCLEEADVYDDGGPEKVASRSFVRNAYQNNGPAKEIAAETANWIVAGTGRKLHESTKEAIASHVRVVDSEGKVH